MHPLDGSSLGKRLPWMTRPLDNASLGRRIPRKIAPLDDASLGLCIPRKMAPLDDASLIEAAANHNNKFLKLRLPDTWTTSRMPSLQPLHSEEWNVWDCAIYWTFRPCKRCIVHRTLRSRDTLCKGSIILEKLYVIRVYIQRRIVKSPKSA